MPPATSLRLKGLDKKVSVALGIRRESIRVCGVHYAYGYFLTGEGEDALSSRRSRIPRDGNMGYNVLSPHSLITYAVHRHDFEHIFHIHTYPLLLMDLIFSNPGLVWASCYLLSFAPDRDRFCPRGGRLTQENKSL